MKKILALFQGFLFLFFLKSLVGEELIKLPEPRFKSNVSLEETLFKRRSIREFSPKPLTLEEVSQLLWAAQGITSSWGGRTAPSAGALYPLEIYVVAGNIENLNCGVYKYEPKSHSLIKKLEEDKRMDVWSSAWGQSWVREAPVLFIITAVYERTTQKYGKRGIRYVHMEAGHAAQNILLQATALNLASVPVGAFNDEALKKSLNIKEDPLYIIAIGKRK